MSFLGKIGEVTITKTRANLHLLAVIGSALFHAIRPATWQRTTRNVFARQILFTGVEALRFVSMVALLTGIGVVFEVQLFLTRIGQSAMLGSILVAVVVRSLAPLLVNFIIIGRSGTAVAVEMAIMKVRNEINILEAQGIDTFLYLAIPRILGMAVSIFCLTIWFIAIAFISGYACGIIIGVGAPAPMEFVETVFKEFRVIDAVALFLQTFVPGLAISSICLMEGLNVQGAYTEVPQAATRAVVRSIGTLVVLFVIIAILIR
jgi:phospholipid/cholesterol/gamma-HCH transport system permease protein